MKKFHSTLEDTFRAREAYVVGEDGVGFTGWVKRIDRKYRHFILLDAERDDGKSVGAAVVSHAQHAELLNHDITIKDIPIDKLRPSRYESRKYPKERNADYIRDVHRQDGRRSFLLVRPLEDGYEVIDGNKALWTCKQAGVDSQPCRIIEADDWQAAQRFVYDHLPTAEEVHEGHVDEGWYNDEATVSAIEKLYDDWGDRILDLHPVEYNVERLEITV